MKRLRSAIEDELEQLYDAYYDELEEYAHQLKDTPTKPSSSGNITHHHAIEPEHDKDGGHAEDIDQDSHDSHDSHDGSDDEDGDDDVDGPGSGIRDVTTQLLPAYDGPNIAQATGKANGSEPCRACLFSFVGGNGGNEPNQHLLIWIHRRLGKRCSPNEQLHQNSPQPAL